MHATLVQSLPILVWEGGAGRLLPIPNSEQQDDAIHLVIVPDSMEEAQ